VCFRRELLTNAWTKVTARLSEAVRFSEEFRNAIADSLGGSP